MYPFHVPYYSLAKPKSSSSSSSSSSMHRNSGGKHGHQNHQNQNHQNHNNNQPQNQHRYRHRHSRSSNNSYSPYGHQLLSTPPFRERPPWFRTSSPLARRGQHGRAQQTQQTQQTKNTRPLQARTQYESGYYDGERDGMRTGLAQGRQEGIDHGRTEGYRAGHADGFAQGHQQGHQQGSGQILEKSHEEYDEKDPQTAFSDGYNTGFLDAFEKGYYQGCTDGFFQLYSIYPDSDYTKVCHGDPTSPYAGNSTEIYAGCSGDSSQLGTAEDVEVLEVLEVALSDTETVVHTAAAQPEEAVAIEIPAPTATPVEETGSQPEHITYLTPVSPSAPLVRVASAPDFRDMAALVRPSSAQGQLCYSDKIADVAEKNTFTDDGLAIIADAALQLQRTGSTEADRDPAVFTEAQGTAQDAAEETAQKTIHVSLAKDGLLQAAREDQEDQEDQTNQSGPDQTEESMFMPAYSDDSEEYHPEEPQTPDRPHILHGNNNDESDSLIKIASPRSGSSPAVFSNLFIFPYQCNPVLGYPSPLSYAAPAPRGAPDQPTRSEYITEAYAAFHQRQRHTSFSVYRIDSDRLTDRIGIVRKAVDTMDEEERSLSAFPAVFPVSGSLKASPASVASVPEHVIYKYAVHPYELAKCVHHSLTTCPMCAITPSCSFLGPGESLVHGRVFRLDGVQRYPPGGNGEACSDREFSEVKEYTYPVGFCFGMASQGLKTLKGHGVVAGETALSEIQHPDEADPGRSRLFDPQLDEEVLGHTPTSEDMAHATVSSDDAKDSLPATHYCLDCGGLTWLKTKRKYFYARNESRAQEDEGRDQKKEEETKETKRKYQKKRGKRAKREKEKGKAKQVAVKVAIDVDDNGNGNGNGNSSDKELEIKLFEITLGTQHPSHHASFNEPWSLYKYWTKDDTAAIYPEESGTTRSLFVQVAVRPKRQIQARPESVLSAYFGPDSLFNSRTTFDLATAADGEGRLLRDLPFETFNRNAPHLAAVALALYEVWMGVVPSHRTAIDKVTRWNSDHSRRKAYRFRVVVVTPSAYVVDLLGSELKEKWQRHLFHFDSRSKAEGGKSAVFQEATAPAAPTGAPEAATKTNETGSPARKKRKKKSKAKKARERAKKAEAKKKRVEQAAAECRLQDEDTEVGAEVEVEVDAEVDAEDAPDAPDAPDNSEYYYDSRTPSSGASPLRFASGQHRHLEEDDTWRVLADLAESMRDATDFERPGVGRYVYADMRDMKRLLPNGVLVHLVVRYMELLRWHGVHVAFYHARESTTTEGAQMLASTCGGL